MVCSLRFRGGIIYVIDIACVYSERIVLQAVDSVFMWRAMSQPCGSEGLVFPRAFWPCMLAE